MSYRAVSPLIKRIKDALQAILKKRQSVLKNSMERVEDIVQRAEDMPRENFRERQHKKRLAIKTQNDFKILITRTLTYPDDMKPLRRNRIAYWNDEEVFCVVEDPHDQDYGTAFWPFSGKAYFDRLK